MLFLKLLAAKIFVPSSGTSDTADSTKGIDVC